MQKKIGTFSKRGNWFPDILYLQKQGRRSEVSVQVLCSVPVFLDSGQPSIILVLGYEIFDFLVPDKLVSVNPLERYI